MPIMRDRLMENTHGNREDMAWAAGFFDGEGCFHLFRPPGRKQTAIARISQIHPDVLERFSRAVGLGKVRGPYPRKGENNRPVWDWYVSTFEETQAVVAMLWPWLGVVKRKQAASVLSRSDVYIVGWRKCQLAGHRVVAVERKDGAFMRCNTCATNRMREYRRAS